MQNEQQNQWNWEFIKKKTSVVQNVVVIIAAIFGGIWALQQFFAEGKNVSGPNISLSAKQLQTKGPYLIDVTVNITGSDRRGYYYDFREAYLSVVKTSFTNESDPDLKAIARIPPVIFDVTKDGEVAGFISHRSHISSYRKSSFTFLVPVPGPGVYLVTFAMPSSGVLDAKSGRVPEIETSDPRILGVFMGESKAIYINVSKQEGAVDTS